MRLLTVFSMCDLLDSEHLSCGDKAFFGEVKVISNELANQKKQTRTFSALNSFINVETETVKGYWLLLTLLATQGFTF